MSKRASPWPYFAATFAWTWLFWIPAAISGRDVLQFPIMLLLALGGLGPAFAAILLTYLRGDADERRDYWQRVIGFRGIRLPWWAVIALLSPILGALAVATGLLAGQDLPSFDTARGFLSQPLTFVPFLLYTLVFGPLPEELGWRGFALDRLQGRRNALVSSLVLGLLWAAWHLPMFFMQGTYQQSEIGIGTMRFWLGFCASIVTLTVLMTWVYNNTRRSTLSAILMHFMANLTGEVLNLPGQMEYYRAIWTVVAAIAVVAIWGPQRLTRRKARLDAQGDQI